MFMVLLDDMESGNFKIFCLNVFYFLYYVKEDWNIWNSMYFMQYVEQMYVMDEYSDFYLGLFKIF